VKKVPGNQNQSYRSVMKTLLPGPDLPIGYAG